MYRTKDEEKERQYFIGDSVKLRFVVENNFFGHIKNVIPYSVKVSVIGPEGEIIRNDVVALDGEVISYEIPDVYLNKMGNYTAYFDMMVNNRKKSHEISFSILPRGNDGTNGEGI